MIRKVVTPCCALCMLRAEDKDSKKSIEKFIRYQKKESFSENWYGQPTGQGQRAIFCIVSPGEFQLENNLLDLGFQEITQLNRRLGYPDGKLRMMMLSW